jgi:hypothetical protein
MCNFLSGLVTLEKHPKVLCRDLVSHDETVRILGIKPETYREWEWTQEDAGESLTVRVMPGEDATVLASAILAQFPRRIDCLNDCIKQMVESGIKELALPSLTSAEGLTLPSGIKWLYLYSLTSAKGLTLPSGIETLYLNSLTSAKGLTLPSGIKELYLPDAVRAQLKKRGQNARLRHTHS